ncbi:hypothetical protein IW261DRAFT_1422428 [Armillaria novae-zelandiae]|uniref:Uncharacterized protein n=1 Tax=Armillaria novae-zelandiae TaxID=153914 RepID=A0AA39P146_9AGAR|nr:hypothetical protein IW261DRAFT_1422428 [Armillaria novae-zelandiae]
MRPVVSYDDIVPDPRPSLNNDSPSPPKKLKTDGNPAIAFEHSRELTHAEIWNDSVLIDAWEALQEEYTAYHGGDTSLKTNPTKKSPLWYNVPFDDSKVKENDTEDSSSQEEDDDEADDDDDDDDDGDSKPINFDTFVPSHDASLETGDDFATGASYTLHESSAETVTQDEAFTRAANAMYWAGYWTAMYHCQRGDGAGTEEDEVEGMVSEFVSTQR